jgi:hypothetical protein
MGLRLLASWDCGFDSRHEHGCLSVGIVACCHAEISASDRFLVQRTPKKCGASECDREVLIMGRPWTTGGCCTMEEKSVNY